MIDKKKEGKIPGIPGFNKFGANPQMRERKRARHKIAERELPNYLRLKKTFGFRLDPDNEMYLRGQFNKSEFINKAMRAFIRLINNPEAILKELKERYPELYKHVGRKK